MKKNTTSKYNEDFKKMVVDLYRSGQPVRQLSSEYGVSDVTIYKWIKKYSPIGEVDDKVVTQADHPLW